MSVALTDFAVERMHALSKTACCVLVKRGGCFGYKTIFEFSNAGVLINEQSGISIYLDSEIEVDLIIDYKTSLIQSSFIVTPINASTCCCNRSIKIGQAKLDKTQCLS